MSSAETGRNDTPPNEALQKAILRLYNAFETDNVELLQVQLSGWPSDLSNVAPILAGFIQDLCRVTELEPDSRQQKAIAASIETLKEYCSSTGQFPTVLLPAWNMLRNVQNQGRVTESVFWRPSARILPPAFTGTAPTHKETEFAVTTKKLYTSFQSAMLSALKGESSAWDELQQISLQVRDLAIQTPQFHIWNIAAATFSAYQQGGILPDGLELNFFIKELVGRLKTLFDDGPAALQLPVEEDLLKQLLYYLANARFGNALSDEVISLFNLDDMLLQDAIQHIDGFTEIDSELEVEPEEEQQSIHQEDIAQFRNDARNTIDFLEQGIPMWASEIGNQELQQRVATSFGLIKESGLKVRAAIIVTLADSVEQLLQAVLEGKLQPTSEFAAVSLQALDHIRDTLLGEYFAGKEEEPVVVRDLRGRIASLMAPEEKPDKKPDEDVEDKVRDIFLAEAAVHLQDAQQWLGSALAANHPVELTEQLRRALHTLKGSANMAGFFEIGRLAEPMEMFVKDMRGCQVEADRVVKVIMQRGLDLIAEAISDLPELGESQKLEGLDVYIADLQALHREKMAFVSKVGLGERSATLPEFISAYLAESMEHLLIAYDTLIEWQETEQIEDDSLKGLIAELAYLRKSAMQADLQPIALLCQALENVYQLVVEDRLRVDNAFFVIARQAQDGLMDCLDQIAAGQELQPHGYIDSLRNLAATASQPENPPEAPKQDASEEAPDNNNEQPAQEQAQPGVDETTMDNNDDLEIDEEILELFLEEAGELQEGIEEATQSWLEMRENDAPAAELKRLLHTLKGGARLAGVTPLGDVSHNFETYIIRHEGKTLDDAFFAVVEKYVDACSMMVEALSSGQPLPDVSGIEDSGAVAAEVAQPEETTEDVQAEEAVEQEELAEPAEEIAAEAMDLDDDIDPEILDLFMEEAQELQASIDNLLQSWMDAPDDADAVAEMKRVLHTLKGGARLAGIMSLGSIAHEFESYIIANEGKTYDEAFFAKLQNFQEQADRSIDKLNAMVAGAAAPEPTPMPAKPMAPLVAEGESVTMADEVQEADSEILELFLEEATELQAGLDNSITAWLEDKNNSEHLDELKRLLHTLKGGARLAGLMSIGTLAHDFETDLINSEGQDLDEAFFKKVQDYYEKLVVAIEDASAGEVEQQTAVAPDASMDDSAMEQAAEAFLKAAQEKADKKGSQEAVKVSAELLDNLVNLAGETSISRSRIEERLIDLRLQLQEMDDTILRMEDQLRRLDMETQAQVASRYEQMAQQEDFDPLEMDRYSSLQQLTRALIESSTDIADFRNTLEDRYRDVETLLLQQSRINTELQEGLMRSQMVSFSKIVPRLRRIVRQTSGELGKKVDFALVNVEGELDRTVLERMVAPLEHMLRNGLDHGVEMPEERVAAGKPETGTIKLTVGRDGGDVMIVLADDGKGVDIEAVRKKAIERGLMTDNANLSDHEILQFIMSAGFSTAQKVTQISGRGVGMDVVSSEIKQLGGTVDIASVYGQGTTFTIRLPFTVSVNRALMVGVEHEVYSIPLEAIEGIVRVSPFELEAYYQPDAPPFEYAGQPYNLRYLGRMLRRGAKPDLEEQTSPLPVILVRGGDHSVAIQVDTLLGSREIVVKSLGPQFGMVQGVTGATVLGDGSVVVILDIQAMIRQDISHAGDWDDEVEEETSSSKVTTVMVVDDSITVRKVTSRFLSREGYEVLLAKDGLDAVEQLQEVVPDCMLLDVEMPRMDGFEVASRVRHGTRTKDVPIIMITSRTGEKHRERAMSIGVNEYMGKPFQEAQLLENIQKVTGRKVTAAKE